MANSLGKRAEDIVASFLKQQGMQILEQNKTYAVGELDVIAREGETLVFVEVKYRKNLDFGHPHEAVSKAKQKKIIRAAQLYLRQFKKDPPCRFDVVSLWGDLERPAIDHLRDAFWLEED